MRIPNVDDLKSKITAGKGYANPSLYYIQLPVGILQFSRYSSFPLKNITPLFVTLILLVLEEAIKPPSQL